MPALADHQPHHVRPPAAFARGMRIAGLIGFLMMNAVRRDPENRTTLQRQRPADSEEIFDPKWNLIGPVRVQAMVTHANAQARRYPIQKNGDGKRAPAESK